jgi:hypothetical protein
VIGDKYNGPVFRKVLVIDKRNRRAKEKIAVCEEEIEHINGYLMCLIPAEFITQPLHRLENDQRQKEEKIKQRAKNIA